MPKNTYNSFGENFEFNIQKPEIEISEGSNRFIKILNVAKNSCYQDKFKNLLN